MKNKYCPVPESEHGEDGKVKTSVGEMPCRYCEALESMRVDMGKEIQVTGDTSDGYHTFNELYEFRKLYNARLFNEWANGHKYGFAVKYDVHKSKRHSDGELCFGGGWFIVMAELPTGQISNHYEMKDWDLFNIPEKKKANEWDGHTSQDVLKRLRQSFGGGKLEVDKKGMRKIMQDSFYIHNGAYYCTEHNEKNCLICLT